MLLAGTIKQRALEVGFDLVGIAPSSNAKDLAFLQQWLKKGYGGEMRYLANPQRQDPRHVLPSLKSILCLGLIYNAPYPYSTETSGPRGGDRDSNPGARSSNGYSRAWISRYGWGMDYHQGMRRKLEKLRQILEGMASNVETRVYVDTGPVVERAFARLSGIGWAGKNTCLINEQKGSWFFLGVILTNLELESDVPAPDRCGTCTRCLEACPTGALVEPYVMDASRCLAYFNIELRGTIPEQFRPAMGANVFGCDICQDVCPWNSRTAPSVDGGPSKETSGDQNLARSTRRHAGTTTLAEFQPMQVEVGSPGQIQKLAGEGKPAHEHASGATFSLFNPALDELARMTEEDFRLAFSRSPIKRTQYRGWLRNLCVAMGNSGDRRFIPWLETTADHPDPVVQEQAAWALRQLEGSPHLEGRRG